MKKLLAAVLTLSTVAFAAPPPQNLKGAPQGGDVGGYDDDRREERREDMEKRMRMMLVVGIAEALSLNETEAIRLADKIKVYDDKRKPLREQQHESMKVLKAAADGDAVALGKVDQATNALLDLRQQMAVVDKEMFVGVSKDLKPQQRAQLALFLAKFMHQAKGGMGMGPGGFGKRGGRHHGGDHQRVGK